MTRQFRHEKLKMGRSTKVDDVQSMSVCSSKEQRLFVLTQERIELYRKD